MYDLCSMRARKWAYVIKLVCYFFLYYVFIIRLCFFFCVCVTYYLRSKGRHAYYYIIYVYTRGKKKNLLVSFRSRSLNARGRGCAAPMEFGCIHQISVSDSIVISGISSRVFGEREGARKTKEMAEKEKKTIEMIKCECVRRRDQIAPATCRRGVYLYTVFFKNSFSFDFVCAQKL